MHLLVRAAVILAAGAAGLAVAARNRKKQADANGGTRVVYLSDEDAVIDGDKEPAEATVKSCFRRMNPLTLEAANEAVFLLEDGTEIKLSFTGEGGLHMKSGDRGLLTWRGMRLIRFEMDNGDVIGGSFYAPAGEDSDE